MSVFDGGMQEKAPIVGKLRMECNTQKALLGLGEYIQVHDGTHGRLSQIESRQTTRLLEDEPLGGGLREEHQISGLSQVTENRYKFYANVGSLDIVTVYFWEPGWPVARCAERGLGSTQSVGLVIHGVALNDKRSESIATHRAKQEKC